MTFQSNLAHQLIVIVYNGLIKSVPRGRQRYMDDPFVIHSLVLRMIAGLEGGTYYKDVTLQSSLFRYSVDAVAVKSKKKSNTV